MAKEENIKQEVTIFMSELIARLIQETIDADQAVTADYLEEIKAYAFDNPESEHPKLKTVSFEMTDDEGRRQEVTIPVLSLLPLPVLHISEATFDIDTQLTFVERTSPTSTQDLLQGRKIRSAKGLTDAVSESKKVDISNITQNLISRYEIIATAPGTSSSKKPLIKNPENNSSDEQSQTHSFYAKIHVKLEQSVLPSGMRGLLQETDRNITTKLIK